MANFRFIEQSYEILGFFGQFAQCHDDEPTEFIADVARTCYKSVPKSRDANERLVRSLIRNGHEAMIEHSFLSVRFHTDRAIANELVRHRHFSFAQESTRFVNSSKRGFEFVLPDGIAVEQRQVIKASCIEAANRYEQLEGLFGAKPEIARAVLPLCTATTIVVSGNFREWRHMLKLRTAKDAHPQMRELMVPLLKDLQEQVPAVFEDIRP